MIVPRGSRPALMSLLALVLASAVGDAQVATAIPNQAWIDAYVNGSRALETGELDSARASFTVARTLARHNTATLVQSAAVCARRGETDAAITFLEAAVAAGYDDAALLEWDPDLESTRRDSRFAALVDRARSAAKPATKVAAAPFVPLRIAGDVLAISSDGALAALGNDTVVTVADLGRDRLVAQFPQCGDRPRRIEFSADGARLLVESESHAAGGREVFTLEYDVASRRRVGERPGPLAVVAGIPDPPVARYAVETEAAEEPGVVRVVDVTSGRIVARIETSDPVQVRAAAEDGSALLLRAWGAPNVYAVDAATGVVSTAITDAPLQLALTFVGHSRNWVAIRGDGRTSFHSFDDPAAIRVSQLDFSMLPTGNTDPSARFVARTDSAGRVLLVLRDFADLSAYSVADGRRRWTTRSAEAQSSIQEFIVAGDAVLVQCGGGRLNRLDPESGDTLARFVPPLRAPEPSLLGPPFVESDRELESKGVSPAAIDRAVSALGSAVVRCVAAHDGELWIGTEPATIHVFRAGESKPSATIDFRDLDPLRTTEIGTITISPSGDIVAVGSIGFGMVAAYDRATRRPRWSFDFGGGNGSAIWARFSADGTWIAVSGQSRRNSRIVAARTGDLVLDLGDRGITELRPTVEASRVLATGDRGIEVLEVPSGHVTSRRVELEDGGDIEVDPLGYVFADARSLSRVHRFVGSGSDDLATLAPYLLDLKKIRAAAAGVAITPPVLPE